MAAPFQNYSGGVLLADIVKRNNFSAYVSQAIKERSLFIQNLTQYLQLKRLLMVLLHGVQAPMVI